MPVAAVEVEEFAATGEDEEGDLNVTENRKLTSLLNQTLSPLRESHLAAAFVCNSLQLQLPAPHSRSDLT